LSGKLQEVIVVQLEVFVDFGIQRIRWCLLGGSLLLCTLSRSSLLLLLFLMFSLGLLLGLRGLLGLGGDELRLL